MLNKKEIYLKLFSFDYKKYKFPCYTKHTVVIDKKSTIKSILEKINKDNFLQISYVESSIFLINSSYYANLDDSLMKIVENFGVDIQIDSADNRYSSKDFVLNENNFNSKNSMLTLKDENNLDLIKLLKKAYYSCAVTKLLPDYISPVYIIKAYVKLFCEGCSLFEKEDIIKNLINAENGIFNTTEANLFNSKNIYGIDYLTMVSKLKGMLINDKKVKDDRLSGIYKDYKKEITEHGIVNLYMLSAKYKKISLDGDTKLVKIQRSNANKYQLKMMLN